MSKVKKYLDQVILDETDPYRFVTLELFYSNPDIGVKECKELIHLFATGYVKLGRFCDTGLCDPDGLTDPGDLVIYR